MRTLFKMAVALFVLSMSSHLQAQFFVEKDRNVIFQLRGGMNLSNVSSWKNEYGFKKGKVRMGYNVSGIADITVGKDTYLQTGLSFRTKGAKINSLSTPEGDMEAVMEAMYIQLPVYITYKFNFPGDSHLVFAIGPYVAYGVGGKTTFTSLSDSASTVQNTFGNEGLWNNLDAGLGIELQAEVSRFVFIIGSDTGFTRIWKRERLTDNLKVRNNTVYFTLGVKI
jgi:hypothetical protein